MTNEEIIRQFPYVLLMKDLPELLDLARADEREKLSKEIYSLRSDFYTNYGTRITAITVEKLHTILPEKGVEF